MTIINKPAGSLIPYINNPRKNDAAVDKVAASIKEFGFKVPIIIDNENVIVAGHTRLLAAKKLGIESVPCVIADDLTPAQIKAYRIADNKTAEFAEWDDELLKIELEALEGLDFDIDLTGFDKSEIDKLLAGDDSSEVTEDDSFDLTAALEAASFVKPGDIWTVGRHRLMCGDATKAEDVTLLMDGKKANLCVTDAPYNCSYEGGTGMKIMNDSMDGKAFYAFLLSAFKNIYYSLADGSAVYFFHSDAEKVNFFNATVDAGFHYSTTCIWVKNSLVLGRMDYQMRHEPVIYAFKDTAKHRWYSDRKQTTVWEFDRPTKSNLHPTMKSLPLIAYPVKNSSAPNGIVLDSFGGSGSTLMVCEQTDRICYMMEIDPKYASVILRRYAELKGSSESINVERDGKTYAYDELVKVVENGKQ